MERIQFVSNLVFGFMRNSTVCPLGKRHLVVILIIARLGASGYVLQKIHRWHLLGNSRTEPYRSIQYGCNTLRTSPARLCTNSIRVPNVLASSLLIGNRTDIPPTAIPGVRVFVRLQHRTDYSGMVQYDLSTGTRHIGIFGGNAMRVPRVPIYPRQQYRASLYVFCTASIAYQALTGMVRYELNTSY